MKIQEIEATREKITVRSDNSGTHAVITEVDLGEPHTQLMMPERLYSETAYMVCARSDDGIYSERCERIADAMLDGWRLWPDVFRAIEDAKNLVA